VPAGIEDEALRWLRRHDEREYSFVDATSFAFMWAKGISEALLRRRLRGSRLHRTAAIGKTNPEQRPVVETNDPGRRGRRRTRANVCWSPSEGNRRQGVAGRDPAVPLRHLWAVHIKTQPYKKIKSQYVFSL